MYPAHPKRTLDIFIVGSPYSGSTLLANALNGHPAIANAGEISACFPAFPLGVKTPFCPLCAASGLACPVWTPAFIEQVRRAGPKSSRALFRAVSGSPIVVDSSKFPAWLDWAWDESGTETAVIQIVRNPFAYHVSNRRRVGANARTSAQEWADCYKKALDWVSEHRVLTHVVRYEELASSPATTLQSVATSLGIDWAPGMLRYWEASMHALNGNAGAYMRYPEFARKVEFEKAEDAQVAAAYAMRDFGGWSDSKWHGACTPDEVDLLLTGVAGRLLQELTAGYGYDLDKLVESARCRTPAGLASALGMPLC